MKTHVISTIALGFIGATSAHAATIVGELQTSNGNVLPDPIIAASTDLLQTDFGSVVGAPTAGEAILRDGLTGTAREGGSTHPGLWLDVGGALETTYTLDVSTNTLGFDIQDIRVFTGWDSNRAQAGYVISYSTVGDASFTTLGTVASPADQGSANNANDRMFLTRTYDDGGATIAGLTGVDAIRFNWDFSDNTNGGTRGPVVREIDIIGLATVAVPEPSSAALLGLGAFALVLRRKK